MSRDTLPFFALIRGTLFLSIAVSPIVLVKRS
nr:MAG TPA: hypothetical protein [Caudoviricetes sp.]